VAKFENYGVARVALARAGLPRARK